MAPRTEANLRYYAAHREEILARRRAQSANPETKTKKAAYNKGYYAKNGEKLRDEAKAYYLKNYDKVLGRLYGISQQEYDEMLIRQDGHCAICPTEPTAKKKLCVDHDHTTGKVRGLLCHDCNIAIGKFKENPMLVQRAALYLNQQNNLKLQ